MARHLYRLSLAVAACLLAFSAQADDGASVYATHCLTCHQADGYGVPFMQPPLVGSEILAGPPEGLIAFVLTGNQDPGEWSNPMGSFAFLSDDEMAAVLSYSRSAFANADSVSPDLVAEIREMVGP